MGFFFFFFLCVFCNKILVFWSFRHKNHELGVLPFHRLASTFVFTLYIVTPSTVTAFGQHISCNKNNLLHPNFNRDVEQLLIYTF